MEELTFMICYNCGKIAEKALESYHKFHDNEIKLFGKSEDFKDLPYHKNNKFIILDEDQYLRDNYTGHTGTSYLWAKVIQGHYGDYERFIQIDSDVIFLKECLSDIRNGFDDGYDLIGSRRTYLKHRPIPDPVHTSFIGVKKDKITKNIPFDVFQKMCGGHYTPLGIHINDFFDPVSFDVIFNGGKTLHLKPEDYGHCDELASFDNGFIPLNNWYDFGNKFLHFAGVGSGMNFHKNGYGNVPKFYAGWALHRYSAYMSIFHNEEINVENLITFEEAFSGASKLDVLRKTKEAIC